MQEKIPELKSSVEGLRERLDEMFFKDMTPTSVRSTVSNDSYQSSEKHHSTSIHSCSMKSQLVNRHCSSKPIQKTFMKKESKHIYNVKSQLENRHCSSIPMPKTFQKNDTSVSASDSANIRETSFSKPDSENERKTKAYKENIAENQFANGTNTGLKTQYSDDNFVHAAKIAGLKVRLEQDYESKMAKQGSHGTKMNSQSKLNISVSHQYSIQLNSSVLSPVVKSTTLNKPLTTQLSGASHAFTPAIRSSTLAHPLTVKQSVKSSSYSLHKHALLNSADLFCESDSHKGREFRNENGANQVGSGDCKLKFRENQDTQISALCQNEPLFLGHVTSGKDIGKSGHQSVCLECGAVCVCGQTAIASCLQSDDKSDCEEESLSHLDHEDTNQSNQSLKTKESSWCDNKLAREKVELVSSEMNSKHAIVDVHELVLEEFPESFHEYPGLSTYAMTEAESQDSGISNDTSLKSSASGFEKGFCQFSKSGERSGISDRSSSNVRDDDGGDDDNGDEHHYHHDHSVKHSLLDDLSRSERLQHDVGNGYNDSDGIMTIHGNPPQSQELQYHVVDDYQDSDSIMAISSVNTQNVPNLNESTYSEEHQDKIPQITKHITRVKAKQRDSPKRVRFHFGT